MGYFSAQRLAKSMSKAPARTMAEAPGEAGMIGGVMVFAPLGFAFLPQRRSRDAVDWEKLTAPEGVPGRSPTPVVTRPCAA